MPQIRTVVVRGVAGYLCSTRCEVARGSDKCGRSSLI
jgi:hypothetical protein